MKLVSMTTQGYEQYLKAAIPRYAAEKVAVGTWSGATASELAVAEYQALLPSGVATTNHYFYNIVNQSTTIGYVWLARLVEEPETAFIYDFGIDAVHRNLGLGTLAMTIILQHVKALGFKRLKLHVFGDNQRAKHIYEKSGFQITDIVMQREL